MQVGAPAHTALLTRELLKNEFGSDRLIGKFFDIVWPARSPDLNPFDFFLWGFIRDILFQNKTEHFHSIEELSQALIDAFDEVRNTHMPSVRNACRSFFRRCEECVNVEGRQLCNR